MKNCIGYWRLIDNNLELTVRVKDQKGISLDKMTTSTSACYSIIQLFYNVPNKNYYVVRNAEWAPSRNTCKSSLIFLLMNQWMNQANN